MQKTIISITTKMGEIVTGLNNLMKGFQLEINFQEESTPDTDTISSSQDTYRGSKDFINKMNEECQNLFIDDDDETEKEEL